jgi:hypothetical protein
LHPLPTSPARPPALLDGVKLNGKDPLLLPREDLRRHIMQLLGTHRCALITAPPGAGKSSVIQLLEQDLLARHSRVLFTKAVGLREGMHPELWLVQHARDALRQMEGAVPDVQTLTAAIDAFDYIFIDDAQRTFSYPDFWQTLIKSNGRAQIAFFASYSIETADAATPSVPAKVRAVRWGRCVHGRMSPLTRSLFPVWCALLCVAAGDMVWFSSERQRAAGPR